MINSRHTMATLMLEDGADMRFIQQMLGHANLKTTEIYTQVSIRKLKEIHAATHPGATLERRKASGVATENTGPDDDEQKAVCWPRSTKKRKKNPNRSNAGQEGDRRQLLSSGAREGSRGSRPRPITSSLSDAPCAASFVPHGAQRSSKSLPRSISQHVKSG